MNSEPLSSC